MAVKFTGIFGTQFQISSKTLAIIFAATGALLAALAQKAIPVPMGVPDIAADYAASWANFLIKLWAPIGPATLVLFSDSNPGPLAPQDPPVVAKATQEAKDMGQIAKAILASLILVGALSFFGQARAATHPTTVGHPFGIGIGENSKLSIPTAAQKSSLVAAATPSASVSGNVLGGNLFTSLTSIPTTFAQALQNIISDGTTKIIADLQSMDSVAGATVCGGTGQTACSAAILAANGGSGPVYWNPYAHACAGPAIAFLQSIPSVADVPKPTGPGGILTTAIVAAADLQATQNFVTALTANGIPASLHAACDPLVVWAMRQPATIRADFGGDLINLLTLFQKG